MFHWPVATRPNDPLQAIKMPKTKQTVTRKLTFIFLELCQIRWQLVSKRTWLIAVGRRQNRTQLRGSKHYDHQKKGGKMLNTGAPSWTHCAPQRRSVTTVRGNHLGHHVLVCGVLLTCGRSTVLVASGDRHYLATFSGLSGRERERQRRRRLRRQRRGQRRCAIRASDQRGEAVCTVTWCIDWGSSRHCKRQRRECETTNKTFSRLGQSRDGKKYGLD